MARFSVLIADDEKTLARSMKVFLEEQGLEAQVANEGARALELLDQMRPDLVFLDIRLPKISGMELLKKARALDPPTTAVMMTGYGTIEGAVEAMKLGAFDYITKPIDLDDVKSIADRAEEAKRLERGRSGVGGGDLSDAIIGRCEPMKHAFEEVKRLASLDHAPAVLLTGETGSGKSLIGRALHAQSLRARGPFIEIDCTSLPATLVESELFGHEKGSFTDARESKVGLIEAADGGTAFLDEVGDLELPIQGKLLRAIDERLVRRVGSVKDRRVDVWVIAATNKDLPAMLAAGTFRKDLYYRLAVVTIPLPPLRERAGDIELLATSFLKRYAAKYGKALTAFSEEALASLSAHPWPGNVRELSHVVERAVIGAQPEATEVSASLQLLGAQPAPAGSEGVSPFPGSFPTDGTTLGDWERSIIESAIRKANGNQTRAARILGVSRDTLRYRIAKYQVKARRPD